MEWHTAVLWTKQWWLVWAYASDLKTETWVEIPGRYNIGWGTGHWNIGIPIGGGVLGLQQDADTQIGYYGNGNFWTKCGTSYIA